MYGRTCTALTLERCSPSICYVELCMSCKNIHLKKDIEEKTRMNYIVHNMYPTESQLNHNRERTASILFSLSNTLHWSNEHYLEFLFELFMFYVARVRFTCVSPFWMIWREYVMRIVFSGREFVVWTINQYAHVCNGLCNGRVRIWWV